MEEAALERTLRRTRRRNKHRQTRRVTTMTGRTQPAARVVEANPRPRTLTTLTWGGFGGIGWEDKSGKETGAKELKENRVRRQPKLMPRRPRSADR